MGLSPAIVIGAVGAWFAYLAWRDRLPFARLEYVVMTKSALVPEKWAGSLRLIHNDVEVGEPALVIVRIVNTGDQAIGPEDFVTPLKITLHGVSDIASVNQTGQRPADLQSDLEISDGMVLLKPTLINPRDMIELQILSSGLPDEVELGGRISELTFKRLHELPYPPGSGPEGELLPFDRFMWWVPIPVSAIAFAAAIALDSSSDPAVRILLPAGILIVGLILYPLRARFLVRRREMWRPLKESNRLEESGHASA